MRKQTIQTKVEHMNNIYKKKETRQLYGWEPS